MCDGNDDCPGYEATDEIGCKCKPKFSKRRDSYHLKIFGRRGDQNCSTSSRKPS